jgi:hypothetical protein
MASRIQKVTLLPALCMFVLSILFAFISFIVVDFSLKQGLLILTSSLFIGGLTLAVYWGYSWVWSKKLYESDSGFFLRILSNSRLIGFIVLSSGLFTLAWAFQLVWQDIVVWGKDLGLIFFGSRVGEAIGLGIGMSVVHYFFIGLTFLLIGLVVLLHKFRSCPYYFGYLGSIYRKNPMPLKCFDCSLRMDCLMTDKRSRIGK